MKILTHTIISLITIATFAATNTATIMAQNKKITQTAGRTQLGNFAPEFAKVNDDILFGEVWNDSTLSPHDRSMITISVLVGKGITDSSFLHHLQFAKENGVTRDEIAALLTHAAFYAGWPNAWGAFRIAREVWSDADEAATTGDLELDRFARTMIFPVGQPNDAYAKYFSGRSWLAQVSDKQIPFANVTFEPGCRNNWHIHHATAGGGQMLVGVAGRGWYQEEGKEPVEILPGTVINIPPNVKHWHGAAKDSWFAHLAFSVPGTESSNEWLEPVSDDAYSLLP